MVNASTEPVPVDVDRITVFIPIKHYHAEYLRQAVDSIRGQTRTDWQLLLLIYREMEPALRDVLREQLTDSRVRVVYREGANLAGAYNTAMRAAETIFLTPLLGDDLFAPDAVQVLGDAIRGAPDVDFFHAGRYFVDGAGKRISSDYIPRRSVTAQGFHFGSPVKHLLCWRASRGLACGGVDETLVNFGSDDFDFPWTMFEHGARFQAIPRALYIVRDHRDDFRLTTHVPRSVQLSALRHILEKHHVPADVIRASLRDARRTYLRQSVFRNPLHRWIRERLGYNAQRGWRESYR